MRRRPRRPRTPARRCSQCGQTFRAKPCGFAHASIGRWWPKGAQSQPDGEQWQSIATVPNDGSWVWAMFGTTNPRVTTLKWDAGKGMWMSGTGYWYTPVPFTHWAPMKARPPQVALSQPDGTPK